jgi:hypothetical protein
MQPGKENGSWIANAYHDYSIGKQTLSELSLNYGFSSRTLRRRFDEYCPAATYKKAAGLPPVPLVFDGTFFGRNYGFLIYRAGGKNIHWREMDGEKLAYIEADLLHLKAEGWVFSSFTIDGRRGAIQRLEKLFPGTPIQMCVFHQKKIIQRYITLNPKTDCGKDIKKLISALKDLTEISFYERLKKIKNDYKDFLKERNEKGQFMHRNLRSALRSLTTNYPYLFAYKTYPGLNIPNTTNSCDGSFAHWKAKTTLHRGLKKNRRAQMIKFLLANS